MLSTVQEDLIRFIDYCPSCSNICAKYLNSGIRNANKHLKKLSEDGHLKVIDNNADINQPKVYYTKKQPKLIEHTLQTSRYLVDFLKKYEIVEVARCYNLNKDMIPDALIIAAHEGRMIAFILEVERTTDVYLKIEKYKNYYNEGAYKPLFKIMPPVIILTDKKVNIEPAYTFFILHPLYKDIHLSRSQR